MCPATKKSWDWLELASLGEQLRSEDSLAAKRARILSMTNRLVEGSVDLWIHEDLFRLPDRDEKQPLPPAPAKDGMKLAVKQGKLLTKNGRTKNPASHSTFAAVPLEDQGITLGALQVTRPKGPAFTTEELDLIQGIAQIASVSLFASHRAEVEQFRLRQLNLVREVSAQIANVLDLDELATRITKLIQKTFNFYYVAIFTLKPNFNALRFRSSAVAPRKGRKKASIALEVEVGQGLIGEAAKTGREIVCDNVQEDPRYRFIDSLPETKSEVVIPLKIEDRVLGVLDVQSNQPNAFHPNDLLILHALADNIARAVDSARLYSDLRRRANQLTLVSEVSKSVTSTLDLSRIMRDAAALIHDKFGYPYVSLFTVHPNRRIITYEAGSGKRSKTLEGYSISLDDSQGIMPWVAQNGQAVLANDVSKDERYVPSPLPPKNIQSELCVPLIFNERIVGLLDIQSDKLNAFTEDDRVMFEAVADTMAAAIRNADLYRSEQWRRQISDSLREVAGLVSSNVGVDEVLETILSELDRNLPVDISAVWLLQDNELCLSAVRGVDANKLESICISNPETAYAMAEALMADVPIIRRPDDPMWPSGLTAGYGETYSSIAAPLRVGDRPLGVLTLAHHTSGRYGHEAQAITTTFASYAAVAIENARLYDAAQEQAYASAALLQVAQAVVSLTDLDEILNSITRIMPILVGVKRVALYRWDAEREAFSASQEYGFSESEEAIMTEKEFPAGVFPLLDHVREQNTLTTHPLKAGTKPKAWLKIQPGAENEADAMDADQLLIAVPLSIKSDFFGVMLIEETENGRRFRSRRIEIITGIAQQAALAIQNDLLQLEMVVRERLETEVQLARQIQQTFIPDTLPAPPNWHLAARWRTARQVGGDFYDVIELPNNKLGIFIADVADKGMPAALFMALTRTLVRAAVIEMDSPATVLKRVNDLLLPDTQQGMFVTAVYGELDLGRGTFTYVNAGHNPPFWVKVGGEIEKLSRTAVALGVVEDPKIFERTITLSPGETLFLYTDGLTEAFSPQGDLFGDTRVMDALRASSSATIEAILVAVESSLDEFIDPMPLGDDLTMLAIKKAVE
ncbi:MAG: GAF domain-containing protein [Anaerolineales bacterium]|jgi:GAF domain-containing protein|nr:GAF domain-containing protein [Anaerolineales bacterium]